MDVRSLKTFIAIIENKGFANAAEALHYSQPTISAHIAMLEDELGVTLFYRDKRPVQLTPPGMSLLPHARIIINQMEEARGDVLDFIHAKRGIVRLGTYASASAGYIPGMLQHFRSLYPLIQVKLVELSSNYMENLALSGDIDLFLRQSTPPLSLTKFEHQMLWRELFKVVLWAEHELALLPGPVDPQALLQYDLIMTGRNHTDAILTHPFWHKLRYPPRIIFDVSHPQSLVELVRAKLGIGVTTALAASISKTEGLILKSIADESAVRDVNLYWPKERPLTPACKILKDFILNDAALPRYTTSL